MGWEDACALKVGLNYTRAGSIHLVYQRLSGSIQLVYKRLFFLGTIIWSTNVFLVPFFWSTTFSSSSVLIPGKSG